MGDGTLLFGLGATRAGTTWLYRYLASHPECGLSAVKELHYFDTLDEGNQARMAEVFARQGAVARDAMTTASPDRMAELASWRDDIDGAAKLVASPEDNASYLTYLRQGRRGHVHGDLTPAYGLLDEARLAKMASLAERVKFICLLRDPVDRLWSNVRQVAQRRATRNGPTTTDKVARRAGKIFDRVMQGEEDSIQLRSDYKSAVTRFRNAIPGENLFIAFYEQLFGGDTMARLCDFLGIAVLQPAYAQSYNQAPAIALSDERRAMARGYLAQQYDFISTHMGGQMPDQWRDNKIKV